MNHACKKASRLASDSLDRPLSLVEQLRLWLHTAICGVCKHSNEEIELIHTTAKLIHDQESGRIRLSDEQRQRLQQALQEQCGP